MLAKRKEPGNVNRIREALSAIERAHPEVFTAHLVSSQFELREGIDPLAVNKLIAWALKLLAAPPAVYELPSEVRAALLAELSANIRWIGRGGVSESSTPPELVTLLAELAQPTAEDRIYDPCASDGSVLIACARKIRNQRHRPRLLWGQELSDHALAVANMLAFLEGVPPLNLHEGDVFTQPCFPKEGEALDRHFELIVSSLSPTLSDWPRAELANDPWLRFRHGQPPQGRSDLAYLQHMLASMEPQRGRIVVLTPSGILFRQREDEALRRAFIEENLVEAVISLTHPSAHCAVALLCLRARRTTQEVLLVDVTEPLSVTTLQKILEVRAGGTEIPGFSRLVSPTQLSAGQYSLVPRNYVGRSESVEEPDLSTLRQRVRALDAQLGDARQNLDRALDRLISD